MIFFIGANIDFLIPLAQHIRGDKTFVISSEIDLFVGDELLTNKHPAQIFIDCDHLKVSLQELYAKISKKYQKAVICSIYSVGSGSIMKKLGETGFDHVIPKDDAIYLNVQAIIGSQ